MKESLRKLTSKEAFANIGLHPKDDTTFFLANMVINLVDESRMQVTMFARDNDSFPEDSYVIDKKMRFNHNNVEYIIENEDGKLVVYMPEVLVGSDNQ